MIQKTNAKYTFVLRIICCTHNVRGERCKTIRARHWYPMTARLHGYEVKLIWKTNKNPALRLLGTVRVIVIIAVTFKGV